MEGHMRTSTRLAVVGASALFLVLPVTAASAAPDAPARPHPLRVSGASPVAGCTAGGTATSTNFPGAGVEPSGTTDLRRPDRGGGARQQDRGSDGGAHRLPA